MYDLRVIGNNRYAPQIRHGSVYSKGLYLLQYFQIWSTLRCEWFCTTWKRTEDWYYQPRYFDRQQLSTKRMFPVHVPQWPWHFRWLCGGISKLSSTWVSHFLQIKTKTNISMYQTAFHVKQCCITNTITWLNIRDSD